MPIISNPNSSSPTLFMWEIFEPYKEDFLAAVTCRNGDFDISRPEARQELLPLTGIDGGKFLRPSQVHGERVWDAEKLAGDERLREGDGIYTDRKRTPLLILTADCVPVILFDPYRPAFAVLHAGRRGIGKRIIQRGVAVLRERYGTTPQHLLAAIGPCAHGCCYELPEPMGREFIHNAGLSSGSLQAISNVKSSGKILLDLPTAVTEALRQAGVMPERIETAPYCTICRNDLFYSYRRGDRYRRSGTFAVLR